VKSLIESEILVLWTRSEVIGSAIGQVRYGFQVSGFRCQYKSNPESRRLIALQLKASTGERKSILWATRIQLVDYGCWHL